MKITNRIMLDRLKKNHKLPWWDMQTDGFILMERIVYTVVYMYYSRLILK